MSNKNLYTLFLKHSPKDGNAVFLDVVDGRNLTYTELHTQTGQMLNLLTQKGVLKGDRVVVQVDKSIEAV
ncbi:MAG TPA: malonyl-CoA synthase, partial [Gammaproteobacteria bacterium]|nr:malonyl-CoA synthase [Gammaproteobacteria bacterium]